MQRAHLFRISLLLLVFSVFIGVHAYVSKFSVLYGDELVSIFEANSYSFQELLTRQAEITNPNLYFIFLKILLFISNSAEFSRTIHFFIFLADVFILYKIGQLLDLKKHQLILFLLPFTASLYFLRFAYLLRMYSLGIFFLLLSLYLLVLKLRKGNDKYLVFSWLADVAGILSVYGYLLWLPIKIFLLLWQTASEKKIRRYFWALASVGLFTVASILVVLFYLDHKHDFYDFLSWVKIPEFWDLGLSFISLNGGGIYQYFEGLTDLTAGWKTAGRIVSILLLLFVPYGLKRIKLFLAKTHVSKNNWLQLFESTMWLGYMELIGLFGFTTAFQLNFFHIRQFFVLALLFSIFFGFYLAIKHRSIVATALLTVYLGFSMFGFFRGYVNQSPYPIYTRPFEKDVSWILTYPRDVELGYYYCDARSFQQILSNCPQHKIYFDFNDLKTDMRDTVLFYTTKSLSSNLSEAEVICWEIDYEIVECELQQNESQPIH